MMARRIQLGVLALVGICLIGSAQAATEKASFRIAWSLYIGWMPWDYADRSGILKKWADRYAITVELRQVPSYIESIKQYAAGEVDGCAMSNVDLLGIPVAKGVDSTVVIIGDFSEGNDGIVLKGAHRTLSDIKGLPVNLVQFSVSHYLLTRALDGIGLSERDVRLINTSDAALRGILAASAAAAVVTWKPQLADAIAMPNTTLVFDSSRLSGEIMDLMVLNSDVVRANPKLGNVLAGAWYETLAVMSGHDAAATAAIASMAKASGTDLAGFKDQLATTRFLGMPAEARGLMSGSRIVRTMDLVRSFSFAHGLFGSGAKTVDAVGMEFPGGTTLGSAKNIKVRFDVSFTQRAADRK